MGVRVAHYTSTVPWSSFVFFVFHGGPEIQLMNGALHKNHEISNWVVLAVAVYSPGRHSAFSFQFTMGTVLHSVVSTLDGSGHSYCWSPAQGTHFIISRTRWDCSTVLHWFDYNHHVRVCGAYK
jgi:hypothetical protein